MVLSNKINLLPALRFERFDNNWIETKLGNIAFITKLAGFEFTKYVIYENRGKMIALRGVNIVNNAINLDNVKYIDNSDFSKLKRSKLYKGDIIFTYVGTLGKSALIDKNNKYYLAPNVALIRLKSGDPYYIHQLISTHYYHREYMRPFINTSSQPALSIQSIRQFPIIIPSLSEQRLIGRFFAKLDKLISLQQSKLTLLKKLRKAYLQKLYPHWKSNKPHLRFNKFHNNWENTKLCELSNIQTGSLNANAMVKDGKYNFYTSGVQVYKINDYRFDCNAIIIAGNGAKVGYMHLAHGKFNAYQRTYVLSNFKSDKIFLFHAIHNLMPRLIHRHRRAGNIPYIVIGMLQNLEISVPSLSEQRLIGQFFKRLDDDISLQDNKLQYLRKLKEAYLQKMFC